MDLAQWLGAQLDADERIARAACDGGGGWKADEQASCECCTNVRTATGALVYTPDDRDAPHIAEWSPARVLREIEAKRAVVKLYVTAAGWVERADEIDAPNQNSKVATVAYLDAVKAIAAVYSDREGYAEAVASAG